MSVLFEKGSAAWDIGIIKTRHADGFTRSRHGDLAPCIRVVELTRTAGGDAEARLRAALALPCTCGAGDSAAERTSLRGRQS